MSGTPSQATEARPRRRLLARLRASEEGAVTIPALLWLPLFIMIMTASVELCVLILKQTLLDRGVDLTARILRLGMQPFPTDHDVLKRSICNNIAYIPNCMDRLAVEVFPVDTTTWTAANGAAPLCTDSSSSVALNPVLTGGSSNQMMIMRACLKVDTMTEVDPLAWALVRDAGGQTALVTTTAFVLE